MVLILNYQLLHWALQTFKICMGKGHWGDWKLGAKTAGTWTPREILGFTVNKKPWN